jgi:hypothetical protein
MTPAATALIAAFEASAKAAQTAEDELRKAMAEQVKRLERQRTFAFRRTRLVRILASHAGTADSKLEEVWQAQRRAVHDELGWTGATQAARVKCFSRAKAARYWSWRMSIVQRLFGKLKKHNPR